MSRIARKPLKLPSGVTFTEADGMYSIKGPKGTLQLKKHKAVSISANDDELVFSPVKDEEAAAAMLGTTRVLINNMVTGVTNQFSKKLKLVGVGYRAKLQGTNLELTLGFSHPVSHAIPDGITITVPSQTEVVIEGIDKQKVGQVAADIRSYRPPENYKGKGVRYEDEYVLIKETKKK